MNLLFVASIFPDRRRPVLGTFNQALCQAFLQSDGVDELRIVAPRMWTHVVSDRFRATSPPAGADNRLADLVAYPTYWYTPKSFSHHYGAQMWWSVRDSVSRVTRSSRPDGVLSYWAHPDGEVGLRAARKLGVPCAVIVGGTDVLKLPRNRRRGEAVRRILQGHDAVITVSDGLRDAVIDLGVAPERVHTIYQGVNPDLFSAGSAAAAREELGLPQSGQLLLWVGRCVPVKRVDRLLEAVAELHRRARPVQLCLLGNGPLRSQLEEQTRTLGIADSVRFIGAVPQSKLGTWYRAADLTLLTSESEGLPNVLRESLACGTPFVATDVGSIREIADERFSRVVSMSGETSADVSQLVTAVDSLLEPTVKQAAANYRARTWDDCAAEVVQLFERLRNDRKRGSVAEAPRSLAASSPESSNSEVKESPCLTR